MEMMILAILSPALHCVWQLTGFQEAAITTVSRPLFAQTLLTLVDLCTVLSEEVSYSGAALSCSCKLCIVFVQCLYVQVPLCVCVYVCVCACLEQFFLCTTQILKLLLYMFVCTCVNDGVFC